MWRTKLVHSGEIATARRGIEKWSELDERAAQDRARRREELHYKKKKPVKDLFEEDKKSMLTLPHNPFVVSSVDSAVVNKTGEVKVRKELYHIPKAYVGQKLFVRVYAHHIDFHDAHGQVLLSSQPRKYALEGKEINWAQELECYRNKPRAIEYATYLKNLPPVLRQYLLAPELSERRQRLQSLITLLKEHPLKQVEKAITIGLETKRTDYEALKSIILHLTDQKTSPLLENYTPRQVADWKPDLSAYNILSAGGEAE